MKSNVAIALTVLALTLTSATAQTTTQTEQILTAPKKSMVEYRYAPLDYYFATSRPAEIAALDSTAGFARTGESFQTFVNPISPGLDLNGNPVASGTTPIYRIAFPAIAKNGSRWSHYYTISGSESEAFRVQNPNNVASTPRIPLYEGIDGYVFEADISASGVRNGERTCKPLTEPLYRAYRGRGNFPDDPNYRFTTSKSLYNNLVGSGWDAQGIIACVPAQLTPLTLAQAMIVPQGVQVKIPATELPASVTRVTDAGFLTAVQNGSVMLIDTGMKMTNATNVADRTRDLVFAIYRQNGNYYIKVLFKDNLNATFANIDAGYDRVIIALSGFTFDRAQGAVDGLLFREPSSVPGQTLCSRMYWVDPTSGFSAGFGSKASTACPVWN